MIKEINNDKNNFRSQIEAILFASGDPIDIVKLSKFLKIGKKQCVDEINNLEKSYQENNAGLDLVYKNDKVQLVSNKDCGAVVAKFLNKQCKALINLL